MNSYQSKNRRSANYLKAARFDSPEWIPCQANFLPAVWITHREDIEELVLAHPRLFPGYERGSTDFDQKDMYPLFKTGKQPDNWQCVWETAEPGVHGQVTEHPLADWDRFEQWRANAPNPLTKELFGDRDWDALEKELAQSKADGELASAYTLWHGFFFLRLIDLRGFENFMIDLAMEDPRLMELMKIVEDYDVQVVRKTMECGPEMMIFAEDLGFQTSLPMSPEMWRKFIKPAYERIIGPCRDRGLLNFLHSDGRIIDIIPDLIEVGVHILNPQLRSNGLADLKDVAVGKVCLAQDLDRQLFPFASASEIEDHIGEVHDTLSRPDGGLMLVAEIDHRLPLDKVDAIFDALEKICKLPDASVQLEK